MSALSLSENQLTGEIPPDLGKNSSLRSLHLDSNQLTGEIPPELGNLSSLEYLVLANNNLSGEIPPELGNLSSLKGLDISSNNFTGEIPSELGRLSHAESLWLGGNLTGCVPKELLEIESSNFAGVRSPLLILSPYAKQRRCCGPFVVGLPSSSNQSLRVHGASR